MKQFYQQDKIELGLDEAGRGALIGPVCIGAVILGDIHENPPPYPIKDSKQCSPKKRKILREYIENNSIAFSVQFVSEKTVDEMNVLQATMLGMHKCIDEITKQINLDTILVDGNYFPIYTDENLEPINHVCIPKGDNTYMNIAAASILAKEYHDEYIHNLVQKNPILNKYDLSKNKGYGTKNHINTIKDLGLTEWHRKSVKFNI